MYNVKGAAFDYAKQAIRSTLRWKPLGKEKFYCTGFRVCKSKPANTKTSFVVFRGGIIKRELITAPNLAWPSVRTANHPTLRSTSLGLRLVSPPVETPLVVVLRGPKSPAKTQYAQTQYPQGVLCECIADAQTLLEEGVKLIVLDFPWTNPRTKLLVYNLSPIPHKLKIVYMNNSPSAVGRWEKWAGELKSHVAW